MDINVIKQELEKLKQKPTKKKFEKIDREKILWKPKVGKQVIRIVPSKNDKSNPFKTVEVHYGIGKFPMLALTNWGEQDPIVEFAVQLQKSANGDKESWKTGKKLEPKMRIYAPVIVRGEEHLGTRLWEFGKEIYLELLGIAEDEDIGDYTSITDGRDITVTTEKGPIYNKSTIRVKSKTSPITDDKELLNKILNEQPDILKIYEKKTYQEMKDVLKTYLETPTSEKSEEAETEVETEEEDDVVDISQKEAPQAKKSKVNSFEELFKEK